MEREIKFRFWQNKGMVFESSGWDENCGINEMFKTMQNEYEIIPMQYTGLKDKHGTEIYEGDIVDNLYGVGNPYGQIVFEDGCFLIKDFDGDLLSPIINIVNESQVVGNIYENTELLTTK